jgi:hypothetical protein
MPLFKTIKLNLLFLVSPSLSDIRIVDAELYPKKKAESPNRKQFRFATDINNRQNVGLEIFICGVFAGTTDC